MKLHKQGHLLKRMIPPTAFLVGRALWASLRLEVFGSEHVAAAYEKHGQVIMSFWHNRLLLFPYAYRYQMQLHRLVAMVSRSHDGQLVAGFLERFGFRTLRGSSSQGGMAIFSQAVRMAREGYDIAISPDGPRGPRYQVQPGIIKLAQMTGLPILPVSYQVSIRKEIDSWDRFIVPGPFAKVAVEVSAAITVPRRAGKEQLELARIRLQDELIRLNDSTLQRLKQHGQPGAILLQCRGSRRN